MRTLAVVPCMIAAILFSLMPAAALAAGAEAPLVSEPAWVSSLEKLGTPMVIVLGVYYILVRHLIPAWERRTERQDKALETHSARLYDLLEKQREDHQVQWAQWRDSIGDVTKSLNRMCALIVAHDERSTGGNAKHLMRKAEEISGERMTEGS